jgi:hypothetical protein
MNRDRLFLIVVGTLVALIVAYGIGLTIILVVTSPEDTTVIRFINSFGTIFAGMLGLCTGYLIGGRNGNGKK